MIRPEPVQITDENVLQVCYALSLYLRDMLGEDWANRMLDVIAALKEADQEGVFADQL